MLRTTLVSTSRPTMSAVRNVADFGQPTAGPVHASTSSTVIDRKSTRLNSSHGYISYAVFFFNDTATTEIYTLSLHDALPIYFFDQWRHAVDVAGFVVRDVLVDVTHDAGKHVEANDVGGAECRRLRPADCRPSTRVHFLDGHRSEEHTSELQSRLHLVCRLFF